MKEINFIMKYAWILVRKVGVVYILENPMQNWVGRSYKIVYIVDISEDLPLG